MPFETILYETEGPIASLTLAREHRLNAIDRQMIAELEEATDAFEADADTRVLVVTGAGRAFSAGADIKERAENAGDLSVQRTSSRISPLFRRLERMDKISVAAVNGPAFGGGCELALACDLRIASTAASFSLPEAKLGILPGAGGTQRLPRLIGPGRAKEMMLLGTTVTAEQALAWGLVNRTVEPNALAGEAQRMAERLVAMAPRSLALVKQAVNVALDAGIDVGLDYEQRCSEVVAVLEDRREGYRAFVEKREPHFTGR
jgi:enoyl-CoA hydratase